MSLLSVPPMADSFKTMCFCLCFSVYPTPLHFSCGKLLFILQHPPLMCPPLPHFSDIPQEPFWAPTAFCPYSWENVRQGALKNICLHISPSAPHFLYSYSSVHLFARSFKKYVLRTYYMPGTGDSIMHKIPCPYGADILVAICVGVLVRLLCNKKQKPT